MAIAMTLESYLSNNKVEYSLVKHHKTASSLDSSSSAHLPSSQVIKAVVLVSNEGEYLMAALGSGRKLSVLKVSELMGEAYLLVDELQLSQLFTDCECGAIPAIGAAYGLRMIIDERFADEVSVYIEAGDHCQLVHMKYFDYAQAVAGAQLADICGEPVGTPKFGDDDISLLDMSAISK